jgi:hypothetical protein
MMTTRKQIDRVDMSFGKYVCKMGRIELGGYGFDRLGGVKIKVNLAKRKGCVYRIASLLKIELFYPIPTHIWR